MCSTAVHMIMNCKGGVGMLKIAHIINNRFAETHFPCNHKCRHWRRRWEKRAKPQKSLDCNSTCFCSAAAASNTNKLMAWHEFRGPPFPCSLFLWLICSITFVFGRWITEKIIQILAYLLTVKIISQLVKNNSIQIMKLYLKRALI